MLKVIFHKSWNETLSEKQKNKVKSAFNFSIDYHNLRNKNHTVKVYFVDIIDENNKNLVGQHVMTSMEESIIYLKKCRSIYSICSTIFHEMTHLKQYLNYDICFTKFGKTWQGKPFPIIDPNNIDTYWEAPYEIDARKYETKMFWKWFLKPFMFWKS